MKAVVGMVARRDPSEAEQIVRKVTTEDLRAAAAHALVDDAVYSNPALAARWVDQIGEPKERDKQLDVIARQWLYTDRVAARKWIQELPVSEERKKRWLEEE